MTLTPYSSIDEGHINPLAMKDTHNRIQKFLGEDEISCRDSRRDIAKLSQRDAD
jgi:hypothetical protein